MTSYKSNPALQTHAKEVKLKLRSAMYKAFKKESEHNLFFTDADLIEIYTDVITQLLKKVDGNINSETYLASCMRENY